MNYLGIVSLQVFGFVFLVLLIIGMALGMPLIILSWIVGAFI